jgi:S-adenosylmethionine hydrolase
MPERAPPLVTLLTDFGAGSGYPAQMKGVILARAPDAAIVDLSHEVPRYDALAGALLLEACVPHFPERAVHCAVVDPGVGTARRPLCVVDREGRRLVGPDNGLFTPFLGEGARAFLLSSPEHAPPPRSATFHGRDLFAPVAAWLAAGGDAERLGPRVDHPVRLPWPSARREDRAIHGEVLLADPFGNLVTSLRAEDVRHGFGVRAVEIAGRRARFVRTFGDGAKGERLAMIGSSGRVEIAVRVGSAQAALGAARGAPVVVRDAGG